VSAPHADLFSAALDHHQRGRLAQAEQIYRQILAADPNHVGSLNFLGVIEHQGGRHESAIDLLRKAIAVNDQIPDCHNGMGEALRALRRYDEAVDHFNRAIALDPSFAEAHNNRGSALAAQGKLDAAVLSFKRALEIEPRSALIHCNLGKAERALDMPQEATASFRAALAQTPDLPEALQNLALLRLAEGDGLEAIQLAHRALTTSDTPETRTLFARILVALRGPPDLPDRDNLLIRAVSAPWARPGELVRVAANVMRHDAAISALIDRITAGWPSRPELSAAELEPLVGNQLLKTVLVSAQNWNADLERLLTTVRRTLLARALATAGPDQANAELLDFACALARQCFINEYVFSTSGPEVEQLSVLWRQFVEALHAGAPIAPLRMTVIASYGPLHAVPDADLLLERAWPEPVRALLKQQVQEPRAEQEDRRRIPRLTAIDDAVSQKVRDQYEENPYPRWVKTAPTEPVSLDAYLAGLFPDFRPLEKGDDVDVLVAGCGTGQALTELAHRLPGARILAIDLSLASLAYARRQLEAAGIANVEFGQADILELGSLERSFDLIESGGVLHHLADPSAGLQVLQARLRPNGLMRLGLYSEIARTNVVQVRAFIAERGYRPTIDDIRRCRQDLLSFAPGTPQWHVTQTSDFFGISECRDLLFHAQERRMTLPGIKALLNACGLNFIGFDLDSFVLERYRKQFPGDAAMMDLDCWHAFEVENPQTFSAMYRFWLQKG
jgi:Tfp pilus assembly protein PilF/SAM-dependent methyltransferase